MDAKDYLLERIRTDANTRILVNRLDALEQEVLINTMNKYLDSEVKKLNEPAVIGQSEQLKAFFEYLDFRDYLNCDPTKAEQIIEDHLKSL